MRSHDIGDCPIDSGDQVHLGTDHRRFGVKRGRSQLDRLGVNMAERIVRPVSSFGLLDRGRNGRQHLIGDRFFFCLRQQAFFDQVLLQRHHRIVTPPLLDFFPTSIKPVVIVGGVGVVAVSLSLDQARPFTLRGRVRLLL